MNLKPFAEAIQTTERYKDDEEYKRFADYIFDEDFGKSVRKNAGNINADIKHFAEQLQDLTKFLDLQHTGDIKDVPAEELAKIAGEVQQMMPHTEKLLERWEATAKINGVDISRNETYRATKDLYEKMQEFSEKAHDVLPEEQQLNAARPEKAEVAEPRKPRPDFTEENDRPRAGFINEDGETVDAGNPHFKVPPRNPNFPKAQAFPDEPNPAAKAGPGFGAGGVDPKFLEPKKGNLGAVAPSPEAPLLDEEGNPTYDKQIRNLLKEAQQDSQDGDQANIGSNSADAVASTTSTNSNQSEAETSADRGRSRSLGETTVKETDITQDERVAQQLEIAKQRMIAMGIPEQFREEALTGMKDQISGMSSPEIAANAIKQSADQLLSQQQAGIQQTQLAQHQAEMQAREGKDKGYNPLSSAIGKALEEASKIGASLMASYQLTPESSNEKQLSYLATAAALPKQAELGQSASISRQT